MYIYIYKYIYIYIIYACIYIYIYIQCIESLLKSQDIARYVFSVYTRTHTHTHTHIRIYAQQTCIEHTHTEIPTIIDPVAQG